MDIREYRPRGGWTRNRKVKEAMGRIMASAGAVALVAAYIIVERCTHGIL
jgi:hypothetical protein